MPQQPFVFRLYFYLPGARGRHSLKSAAHHQDYMGTADKAELLVGAEGIPRAETLAAAAHHLHYLDHEGTLGYMGPLADQPEQAAREILASKGPVWRIIASVAEPDALAMGGDLTTKAGWERALDRLVPATIRQLGLDPDRVHWSAATHRWQAKGGQNPHVHLLFWQTGEPRRTQGRLSDRERQATRRIWASTLYEPERARIGQAKTAARQAARVRVGEVARHPEHQQYHQALAQRLAQLGSALPGHGRLANGYMPPPVKHTVAETVRWLWVQDPVLGQARERFLQAARDLATVYWSDDAARSQNPEGRARALAQVNARAEQDLIERLAGPLLQAARHQRQAVARDAYQEASASARAFLREEAQAERLAPWIARVQREGPTDAVLIDLVQAGRTWAERNQWLADWAGPDLNPEGEDTVRTGRRAWDTTIQTVVQAAARQAQREALAAAWTATLQDHTEMQDRLWSIAESYVHTGRTASDWQAALIAYRETLRTLAATGGALATRRFERDLSHRVQWSDEHRAVDAQVTTADLRRFRRDPAAAEAVVDAVIRSTPALAEAWRHAGFAVAGWRDPVTYRYVREGKDGAWRGTERTIRDPVGAPRLQATFLSERSDQPAAFTVRFPAEPPPPGLAASVWDRDAHRQAVEEARDALRERVRRHLQGIGYERGVFRRVPSVSLSTALLHVTRQAERDTRRTAQWLVETQWRERAAQAAVARQMGVEVAVET